MSRRRVRPEERLDDRQRREERAYWHRLVDEVFDAEPTIAKQSLEMGRGFPSWTGGGGRGSGEPDARMVALVTSPVPDPGELANDWLLDRLELRRAFVRLVARGRALLPADVERARAATDDRSVEVCGECSRPVGAGTDTKAKRRDGVPYCASDCYYRVYRREAS